MSIELLQQDCPHRGSETPSNTVSRFHTCNSPTLRSHESPGRGPCNSPNEIFIPVSRILINTIYRNIDYKISRLYRLRSKLSLLTDYQIVHEVMCSKLKKKIVKLLKCFHRIRTHLKSFTESAFDTFKNVNKVYLKPTQ